MSAHNARAARAHPEERNATIARVLPDYRRWLGAVARDICGPINARHHDDLMQEGYIAMWRAIDSYDPAKGALPSWLTNAATMRMRDIARRNWRTWTTSEPGTRGVVHAEAVASVEQMHEADGFDVEDVLAGAAIDDAIWGYHHGEIAHALDALTPAQRRYVLLRFWGGYQPAELEAMFEVGARNLWTKARPILRDALAHLVPA